MKEQELDGVKVQPLEWTRNWKEYLAGLLTGWTWIEFYGTDSAPVPSGRTFRTDRAAMRDWMASRGDDTNWAVAVLQRNQVRAFLDAWAAGRQARDGGQS
jgi:hypothetical protein